VVQTNDDDSRDRIRDQLGDMCRPFRCSVCIVVAPEGDDLHIMGTCLVTEDVLPMALIAQGIQKALLEYQASAGNGESA